jgi:hypothetical protein
LEDIGLEVGVIFKRVLNAQGEMEWTVFHLAKQKYKWRSLVNVVMDLRVL